MTAPTATIVGPLVYPGNSRKVADRPIRFRCIGPEGAVLRDSDGGMVGETVIFTDGTGMFSQVLTLNSDIDVASGVGPPGTYWQLTAGVNPAVSWSFVLDAGDVGGEIVIGDAAHTVVDPTPRGWVPLPGPGGDKGDKGDTGSPGSLPPGLLSARPASAVAGQTYYATDTGLTYAWTGGAWVTVGAVTPTNLLASAVPTAAPAAVTFSADSTFYGVAALTTPDFVWPAGLVRVSLNDLSVNVAGLNKCDVRLAYSLDSGSTWTGLVSTRVTETDILGFFARGRHLAPVLSAVNAPALTSGTSVRIRAEVARTASSGLASLGFAYGVGAALPSITVEQVR